MIYFWNDKQLARDLKNGSVSESQRFIYFLIYFVLTGLSVSNNNPENTVKFELASNIAKMAVTGGILYLFYKTNKQGDNKGFIERFVCLGFPLGLRCMAAVIPIMLLVKFAPILGAIAMICLLVWYFFRMTELLRIASGQME